MNNKSPHCTHCHKEISSDVSVSPNRGAKINRFLFEKRWFVISVTAAVLCIAACILAVFVGKRNINVPQDYKAALEKATYYTNTLYMSKAAAYNRLISPYDGEFSAEASQYAVNHVIADWNANALEKAKTYSSSMRMSKAAIYNQLISEYSDEFTPEQAQYAIDNLQANYKQNALEKAKAYQKMNMSAEYIYSQLTSDYGEKFTAEEAQYAIDNLE